MCYGGSPLKRIAVLRGSGSTAIVVVAAAALLLLFTGNPVCAQESSNDPPRSDFALPIEIDFDHGAQNGDAIISRYIPLLSFPLGTDWQLINLTLVVVADAPGGVPGRPGNPEPVPGGNVFGLGDLTHAVFFTPPSGSRRLVWGFGPVFGFPTATDERLGSGKWSMGPAVRFAYRPANWNLGVVVVNLSSYAGDSTRGDVNQLLVRGLIRRDLGAGWYFTYGPIITANWNQSSGQRWLIPVGGGIGKSFQIGSRQFTVAVHGYYNAVKPEAAPHSVLRVSLVMPVPLRLQRD